MGLNIPLVEGWGIRSDRNNIILYHNDGNRDIELFYYSRIEDALESFLNKKIRGFDSTSVFGLLQAIKHLQTALSKAIQPLKLKVVSMEQEEENKNV